MRTLLSNGAISLDLATPMALAVTPRGVRIYRDDSVPGGLRTDYDPLLPAMIHPSLPEADQPRTAVQRPRAESMDLVPELADTHVTNQNATCVRIANALNFDPVSVKFVGLSCLATSPCR